MNFGGGRQMQAWPRQSCAPPSPDGGITARRVRGGAPPLRKHLAAGAGAVACLLVFAASGLAGQGSTARYDHPALQYARELLEADLSALRLARPGFLFWRHVFAVPDGSVVFGSAWDGRLLAVLPVAGDWGAGVGRWEDPALATLVRGRSLPRDLPARREALAGILQEEVGPVVHNPSRGDFVLPNLRTYGSFLAEWGAIFERFAVPRELGLAQALVESGFSGTVRSRANALGLCQWLKRNWDRLDRLTPVPIEVQNQTTQAAYCAAYLTVLATKYGSFIPALSEHHAGVANVGRVLVNGARLGAPEVRSQYFAGADFARDLRALSPTRFRDLVGTYGIRSFLYTEMVFGNTVSVLRFLDSIPQQKIYAVRASRSYSLDELVRRTGVSQSELKRYNPALFRQVPQGAALYLPKPVEGLGADITFWHRPPNSAFSAVLDEFVRLSVPLERWEDPAFEAVLEEFRRRFRATRTEEGMVMDAVLAYEIQDLRTSRGILTDFRTNPRITQAFQAGVQQRQEAQVVR